MFWYPSGFEVLEAVDGLDGVKKAAEFKPDLVLMDLVMPIMDGSESIRRIRQTSSGRKACILTLSASVFESDRKISIEAGGDDFLPKPVRVDRLLEKLGKLLKIKWVYKADHSSELNQHLSSAILDPPEAKELLPLNDFAKRGNIRGIRNEIERIEQLDERFYSFCQKNYVNSQKILI